MTEFDSFRVKNPKVGTSSFNAVILNLSLNSMFLFF